MYSYLERNLSAYDSLRKFSIAHDVFPALIFDPRPSEFRIQSQEDYFNIETKGQVIRPDNIEEVAFYSIAQQAELIRSGQISSEELTRIYLDRIKKYDQTLQSVITLTEDLAIKQARQADQEIASGHYRGLLHGIPYGTKDLMSVKGYKTTWGAYPYRDQVIDETAQVIKLLHKAGAVLIAKLSSGALARGDVWFDGQTKNPWDTLQGASGSSAGSGAATAAGLVAFSLGTETLGSIISPSNRNGVTGLRPTYGAVSRKGVMSLSWSMDKVGPICRSAEDCAIVFNAIRGNEDFDDIIGPGKFSFDGQKDILGLKIAVLQDDIDKDTTSSGENARKIVNTLIQLGIKADTISLPHEFPTSCFDIILRAESAAMFDELIRSGDVDNLVQQSRNSRANSLRQARFIPATEYLQANRIRRMLIDKIHLIFRKYDVIIAPTFGGHQLLITNLTGHPVVTLPTGLDGKGRPTSITFIGNLFEEGKILELANHIQRRSSFHTSQPSSFSVKN